MSDSEPPRVVAARQRPLWFRCQRPFGGPPAWGRQPAGQAPYQQCTGGLCARFLALVLSLQGSASHLPQLRPLLFAAADLALRLGRVHL